MVRVPLVEGLHVDLVPVFQHRVSRGDLYLLVMGALEPHQNGWQVFGHRIPGNAVTFRVL